MAQREESLAFGGQALLEGVMIRSPTHIVMCVRQAPDNIVTNVEEVESVTRSHRALGLPVVRGIASLFESMYHGVRGLSFSANVALEEEEEEFTWKEGAIVISLTAAMSAFFFVIPFLLTALLPLEGLLFNVVEATIRLGVFLAYISLVSMWGEFRRVLQYHGAEHKAINAHEAGAAMEVAAVRGYPRLHRRCGTSFIFIVILVSIALFSLIPSPGFVTRLAYRFALIPVIAGVSYELLRLSARHEGSLLMRLLTAPGLGFQRLTTREPDDDMIEVAIAAVQEVLRLSDREPGTDQHEGEPREH
jgi:uncharacterized protein YqhQ